MKKVVFAPGCGLMLYKPETVKKILPILNESFKDIEVLNICCHHDPQFIEETLVVNICPGCDKRYGNNYKNTSTISFLEFLDKNKSNIFKFPDYKGQKMSILDACPTRENEEVHVAIRSLLNKMNIQVVEPEKTRTKSICCGDSFYGLIPTGKVIEQMKKRADEMPEDFVVVYCISCIKSVSNGGKIARHILDLLFVEDTIPGNLNPDVWHKELDDYIANH